MEKNDKFYKIIISLFSLLYIGTGIWDLMSTSNHLHIHGVAVNTANNINLIFGIIFGLIFIIGGVGVFIHKNWGRITCLTLTYIAGIVVLCKIIIVGIRHGLVPSLYGEFIILLFIVFPIYFFTRPKVKEIFN